VPTAYTHETARPGLAVAAECANAFGAPLVVLCSKGAATRRSVEALDKRLRDLGVVQAHVVQVGADSRGLTSFAVDRLSISTAWRRGGDQPGEQRLAVLNDVGQKRNLGLAVARSIAADTVLFVDDDIAVDVEHRGVVTRHPRTLTPASLETATRSVTHGDCAAVGWTARDFDDNSVLMRIRSDMGDAQDQFIGAGALLADVRDERLPFFPSIFNEDWLFLLGYLLDNPRGRVFGEAGDVHQQHRPPYSARRAASEEMGDLLGEGLLSQVRPHGIDLGRCGRIEFWREAFENRCRLRDQLEVRVSNGAHHHKNEMLEALQAIRKIHETVRGDKYAHLNQLAEYVSTWRCDLDRWHEDLARSTIRDSAVAAQTRTLRSWGSSLDIIGPPVG
jgi:hypothetical protein